MKTITTGLLLLIGLVSAAGQSPVPEPDTLKNQIRQIDPAPESVKPNWRDHHDQVRISSAEMPEAVKRALSSDQTYSGWENGKFYRDKAGKFFFIEYSEADTLRTFRFDRSGKLLLD